MSNETSTFRLDARLNLGVEDRDDIDDIDDEILARALRRALVIQGLADRTLTVEVPTPDGETREVSVHFEIPSVDPWEES
jgi:hypothetical protein